MQIKQTAHEIPTQRFTGHEFELLVNKRCAELEQLELADVNQYGVMARVLGYRTVNGKNVPDVQLHKSFPDFEGPIDQEGTQTIFDCKVESSASFDLSRYRVGQDKQSESKRKQLTKMYRRANFGCPCFFLIHFNQRTLKSSTVPAATYAFPVARNHVFWQRFERHEVKRIQLSDCVDYAVDVQWTTIGRGTVPRPDFLSAAYAVRRLAKQGRDFVSVA